MNYDRLKENTDLLDSSSDKVELKFGDWRQLVLFLSLSHLPALVTWGSGTHTGTVSFLSVRKGIAWASWAPQVKHPTVWQGTHKLGRNY